MDVDQAFKLFKKSADNNDPKGKFYLGITKIIDLIAGEKLIIFQE